MVQTALRGPVYTMLILTAKRGDSNCEIIIFFGTKFKLSEDLAVVETDIDLGIYLVTVINDLWNSRNLMVC